MKTNHNYNFWFCVGSQDRYGTEVLDNVARNAQEMVENLNASGALPFPLILKPTMVSSKMILQIFNDANTDIDCARFITWMHTFSPAKPWIRDLQEYNKPLLHLLTQYNEEIPYDRIDMDFMSENQSAHGDREFVHIVSRLGKERKVVAGYWIDPEVRERLGAWMHTAVGIVESSSVRVMRMATI